MTFQYLITTVGKTEEEVKAIIEEANIDGEVLLGNQLRKEDRSYELTVGKTKATVFDMTSKGVSRNRNFLLEHATADYVIFFDDDERIFDGWQKRAEERVSALKKEAVRFNTVSGNPKRPIKILEKEGYVKWRHLSSFGAWGIYFERKYLLATGLKFRENVGPGTDLNHGEDSLFLHDYLQHKKVWSEPSKAFFVKQETSTWQCANADPYKSFVATGYVYGIVYGRLAWAVILYKSILLGKNCRKNDPDITARKIRQAMKRGIRLLKGKEK